MNAVTNDLRLRDFRKGLAQKTLWLSDFFILESWLRMCCSSGTVLFFKAFFKAHVISGWNFWCITVRLSGPRWHEPLCQHHRAECPSQWWQPVTSAGHYCCCSVAKSCLTLQPHGLQHARPPCLSPSLWVCPSSCPLNGWCHPTISSSVTLVFFCLQSFPASGSFPMIQLFAWGGWSIGASALASVLPASIQGWFPLGLTGLISLFSKGLSRTFSSTTVQKHQFLLRSAFFLVQLSHL